MLSASAHPCCIKSSSACLTWLAGSVLQPRMISGSVWVPLVARWRHTICNAGMHTKSTMLRDASAAAKRRFNSLIRCLLTGCQVRPTQQSAGGCASCVGGLGKALRASSPLLAPVPSSVYSHLYYACDVRIYATSGTLPWWLLTRAHARRTAHWFSIGAAISPSPSGRKPLSLPCCSPLHQRRQCTMLLLSCADRGCWVLLLVAWRGP